MHMTVFGLANRQCCSGLYIPGWVKLATISISPFFHYSRRGEITMLLHLLLNRCSRIMLCGVWNSQNIVLHSVYRLPLSPPQLCSLHMQSAPFQLMLQLFQLSRDGFAEPWSSFCIWAVVGSGLGREECGAFLEWWSVFCVMPIPAYKSSALHCQHRWIQFSDASTAS